MYIRTYVQYWQEVDKLEAQELQQLKIEVTAELHERLKLLAVKERTTLRALVTEAVETLLEQREESGQ